MSQYGVVLFHTTSSALRSEKVLQHAGLTTKLIPTPRQFSSDCGLSLRFAWADAHRVQSVLHEAQVELAGVYPLE